MVKLTRLQDVDGDGKEGVENVKDDGRTEVQPDGCLQERQFIDVVNKENMVEEEGNAHYVEYGEQG